jgi:hypothetical protein
MAKMPTRIYNYELQCCANSFVIVTESYPIHNITDKWITYRIPRLDKLYDKKVIRKIYKGNTDKLCSHIKYEMWSFDENAKGKFMELIIEDQKRRLNKTMKQRLVDKDKINSYQEAIKKFERRLKEIKN